MDYEILPYDALQSVTWESSDENVASVDETGEITAIKPGKTSISVKSEQNIDIICTEEIEVIDRYTFELVNSFGFSYTEAKLIRSVYDKIDNIYSSKSNIERAWRCARLLSEFVYDDSFKGDDVANSVTDSDNIKIYFTNYLGYTNQQFSMLRIALIEQHNDITTIDFCHLQYSLAARLAYALEFDGSISNWGTGFVTGNLNYYTNEIISYFAGWLGDAVLTGYNGNTTSFGNDDYMSDLDAENVYHIILQEKSSSEAFSNYYSSLCVSNNRAHIFTSHIDFERVRDRVFYELIDAKLIDLINSDPKNIYYATLLEDEAYHWDFIKNNYNDTYNFLNSLKDLRATISEY